MLVISAVEEKMGWNVDQYLLYNKSPPNAVGFLLTGLWVNCT